MLRRSVLGGCRGNRHQAFPGHGIDDIQDPEAATIGEPVMVQ
jgi:hypothetical protein